MVPVVPNPTVESTVITDAPDCELVSAFVLHGMVKTPSIRSLSLKPKNYDIL